MILFDLLVVLFNHILDSLKDNSAHHFSSTSSMVSGSGTFSVSGRNKAKQDANTAAPPYTTLGRAGNTWEMLSIKTEIILIKMRYAVIIGKINIVINDEINLI